MTGLIAFINGLVALIITGAGAYSAASFVYGGFHFIHGDHQRGKSWIVGSLIGVGIILCSIAIGTAVAALPHA